MKYLIKCDECKHTIGETDELSASAAGGTCDACRSDGEVAPRGGSRADGPLMSGGWTVEPNPTIEGNWSVLDGGTQIAVTVTREHAERIADLERQNADLLAAIRTMQVVARTVIARTGAPAADKGA